MKKVAFVMMLAFGVASGAHAAGEGVGPGLLLAGFTLALTDKAQACDDEPNRLVAWKDNPNGYSFEVAGCDFQAKKDQYVLKKVIK